MLTKSQHFPTKSPLFDQLLTFRQHFGLIPSQIAQYSEKCKQNVNFPLPSTSLAFKFLTKRQHSTSLLSSSLPPHNKSLSPFFRKGSRTFCLFAKERLSPRRGSVAKGAFEIEDRGQRPQRYSPAASKRSQLSLSQRQKKSLPENAREGSLFNSTYTPAPRKAADSDCTVLRRRSARNSKSAALPSSLANPPAIRTSARR